MLIGQLSGRPLPPHRKKVIMMYNLLGTKQKAAQTNYF